MESSKYSSEIDSDILNLIKKMRKGNRRAVARLITKVENGGPDVSKEIRTAEIGELSSVVSARPIVRKGLFTLQRELCLKGNVVIEGRDTGTTIFPESENKFYLDASIEERARRRHADLILKFFMIEEKHLVMKI